jgi:hypothetical protein
LHHSRLLVLLGLALAACGPLGGSPGASPSPAGGPSAPTTIGSSAPQPVSAAAFASCPVTKPVTDEHPKNANTAAFSRAWYVSSDRRLWASAGGRLWAGRSGNGSGNKVLWERPGSIVAISGKLLLEDAKAAGVPTITGPGGYETFDYQASGVTFPVPGCWQVEARADGSVLDFVALVYPRAYAAADRSCVDLKGAFDQSDAVLQASAIAVGEDLPGFASLRLSPKIVYKAPPDFGGLFDLHLDLDEVAAPRSGDGYVLFLARTDEGAWQIVCPWRTLATVDGAGAIQMVALQRGQPLLTNDVRDLDHELRGLAK